MKKKLVFLLFLALICIGIEYETKTYTLGELSGKAYGIIGLAALLALLYIVPASLIILHVQKMEDSTCQLNHRLLGRAIHRGMDFWSCQHLYP